MNLRTVVALGTMALAGCAPSGDGGGGTDGGTDKDGGGAATSTCLDIMNCIAGCANNDNACVDACYAAGSPTGQSQLLDLLNCMNAQQCTDVPCVQTQCSTPLQTCVGSSTTGGGTTNTGGVPPGNVPPELVGSWSGAGWDEDIQLTLNADGSAALMRYKQSSIGSCDMGVTSRWTTGSAVASGNQLTLTLGPGTTTVVWVGGCGSNYQNPTDGVVYRYSYQLDTSRSPAYLTLIDLDCTSGPDYCTDILHL